MPFIVDLKPERVVAALGFGRSPEEQAWGLIEQFAAERDLEIWDGNHRFFGFNNPDPSPGSPNYGYEQWVTVADDINASDPLEMKQFPGGRFATLHVRGLDGIGAAWRQLVAWAEDEGYQIAATDYGCLEELRTPIGLPTEELEFDLYLPVVGDGDRAGSVERD